MAKQYTYKLWYRASIAEGDTLFTLDNEYPIDQIKAEAPEVVRQGLYNSTGIDVGPLTIVDCELLYIRDV